VLFRSQETHNQKVYKEEAPEEVEELASMMEGIALVEPRTSDQLFTQPHLFDNVKLYKPLNKISITPSKINFKEWCLLTYQGQGHEHLLTPYNNLDETPARFFEKLTSVTFRPPLMWIN